MHRNRQRGRLLLYNVFFWSAAVVVQDFRRKLLGLRGETSWLSNWLVGCRRVNLFVFSYPIVRDLTHIQIYTFDLLLGDRRRRVATRDVFDSGLARRVGAEF